MMKKAHELLINCEEALDGVKGEAVARERSGDTINTAVASVDSVKSGLDS